LGITVITANARDFGKLAEFRRFQWRVDDPRTSLTSVLPQGGDFQNEQYRMGSS
jgi:hypothetical protein